MRQLISIVIFLLPFMAYSDEVELTAEEYHKEIEKIFNAAPTAVASLFSTVFDGISNPPLENEAQKE